MNDVSNEWQKRVREAVQSIKFEADVVLKEIEAYECQGVIYLHLKTIEHLVGHAQLALSLFEENK